MAVITHTWEVRWDTVAAACFRGHQQICEHVHEGLRKGPGPHPASQSVKFHLKGGFEVEIRHAGVGESHCTVRESDKWQIWQSFSRGTFF